MGSRDNARMIWNQFALQILNGLGVAAILVIATSGLAIIFGVAGVINMAHGTFIMVGAYTAAVVNKLGGDMFMAMPLAFVVVALLGLAVERGVIRWIYDRPLETLLATWGVAIILEVAARLIFGPLELKVDWPDLLDGNIKLFARPPHYPYYRVFHIVLAAAIMGLTFYLLYKTNFGLKVRAVRRNRAISGCMGVDTAKIDMLIFMYGSGLAGVAGAVLAPIKAATFDMGFTYAVSSYMVIVLGGVGNLLGIPVGAFLIGEGETLLAFRYNTVIGQLLVFVAIVIAIRVFPRGIFGYHERR